MRRAVFSAVLLLALGLSAETPVRAGICIGTALECNRPTLGDPTTYDMLVTFAYDSAVLTADARNNLEEFAKAMLEERFASARFVVEGHTDATGTDEYNLDLSVRRAQAVVEFLIGAGVPEDRLEAVGLGETVPRVADPLAAENRRVETRILLQ